MIGLQRLSFTLLLAIFVSASAQWNSDWCPQYSGFVFSDTASNRRQLNTTVLRYRDTLGGIDNGNNAGTDKGHRSINWDAEAVPFNMPGNFFKNVVTRGAEFLAVDGKFVVSNPSNTDPSGVKDNRFSSINRKFPNLFQTFSPKRLFTPLNSNEVIVLFSVPKSSTGEKASVSGFGAIFTNVNLNGETVMHFFDENECLIFRQIIKSKPKGLSFGGIVVTKKNGAPVKAAVASVKVKLGNGIVSQSWKPKNFVVLDDLIYGEPLAIKY